MNTNAAVKKRNRKFLSIKPGGGGKATMSKALSLIPRIVIPKEIFGFRSRDFLMITIATAFLIAPFIATILLWLIVY